MGSLSSNLGPCSLCFLFSVAGWAKQRGFLAWGGRKKQGAFFQCNSLMHPDSSLCSSRFMCGAQHTHSKCAGDFDALQGQHTGGVSHKHTSTPQKGHFRSSTGTWENEQRGPPTCFQSSVEQAQEMLSTAVRTRILVRLRRGAGSARSESRAWSKVLCNGSLIQCCGQGALKTKREGEGGRKDHCHIQDRKEPEGPCRATSHLDGWSSFESPYRAQKRRRKKCGLPRTSLILTLSSAISFLCPSFHLLLHRRNGAR